MATTEGKDLGRALSDGAIALELSGLLVPPRGTPARMTETVLEAAGVPDLVSAARAVYRASTEPEHGSVHDLDLALPALYKALRKFER